MIGIVFPILPSKMVALNVAEKFAVQDWRDTRIIKTESLIRRDLFRHKRLKEIYAGGY